MHRLAYMISFWNAVIACTYGVPMVRRTVPVMLWDVVRGNALLIASIVAAFYVFHGLGGVLRFYEALFPTIHLPGAVWIGLDLAVHFAPLVWLGWPRSVLGPALSTLVFWAWLGALGTGSRLFDIYRGVPRMFVRTFVLPFLVIVTTILWLRALLGNTTRNHP